MEKGVACTETEQQVKDLHTFILHYKYLINARAVNFFTEDHWGKLINATWQEGLLSTKDPDEFIFPKATGPNGLKHDMIWRRV